MFGPRIICQMNETRYSRLNHFQGKIQPKRHRDVYRHFKSDNKGTLNVLLVERETITVRTKTNGVIIRNGKSEVPKLPCSTVWNGNHILWKADQRQWLQPLCRKKVATLFIFGQIRVALFACWLSSWSLLGFAWCGTWDIAISLRMHKIRQAEWFGVWCVRFHTAHGTSISNSNTQHISSHMK